MQICIWNIQNWNMANQDTAYTSLFCIRDPKWMDHISLFYFIFYANLCWKVGICLPIVGSLQYRTLTNLCTGFL